MEAENIIAVLAVVVGLSLLAAPYTMHDWSEEAYLTVEETNESDIDESVPVIQYTNLSADGRRVVSQAMASEDGDAHIWGREDMPDRFTFSDQPGRYVVVKDGQYYRVLASGAGNLGLLWLLPMLPFMLYGGLLAAVGRRTYAGDPSPEMPALAAGVGVAFHLLGPEFDFPLVPSGQFPTLGLVCAAVLAGWLWITRGAGDAAEA